jgi:hypothetical protein
MRTSSKLALATLTAAIVLGTAVGTAGARRYELSEQHIRAVWSIFELSDVPQTKLARCPITLEGSFHSKTFSKVSGQLIGFITEARTSKPGCTTVPRSLWLDEGGIATLPWHVKYVSFSGRLPAIATIKLQVIGLGVKFVGTECEFRSEAMRPAVLIANVAAGGTMTLRFDETVLIPLQSLLGCNTQGMLAGTSSTVTVQGRETPITIRLVA